MALNVLVVDDSATMRAIIVKTLKMAGLPLAEVYQAENGREGLEVLGSWRVDTVLVDINMPEMNGVEMIERMRFTPDLADVPVFVVSTEGSETRVKELSEKGAGFIQKPFSPEMLKQAVEQLIGGNNGSNN
jgi:two-component system chemotaxis response regulator CheY